MLTRKQWQQVQDFKRAIQRFIDPVQQKNANEYFAKKQRAQSQEEGLQDYEENKNKFTEVLKRLNEPSGVEYAEAYIKGRDIDKYINNTNDYCNILEGDGTPVVLPDPPSEAEEDKNYQNMLRRDLNILSEEKPSEKILQREIEVFGDELDFTFPTSASPSTTSVSTSSLKEEPPVDEKLKEVREDARKLVEAEKNKAQALEQVRNLIKEAESIAEQANSDADLSQQYLQATIDNANVIKTSATETNSNSAELEALLTSAQQEHDKVILEQRTIQLKLAALNVIKNALFQPIKSTDIANPRFDPSFNNLINKAKALKDEVVDAALNIGKSTDNVSSYLTETQENIEKINLAQQSVASDLNTNSQPVQETKVLPEQMSELKKELNRSIVRYGELLDSIESSKLDANVKNEYKKQLSALNSLSERLISPANLQGLVEVAPFEILDSTCKALIHSINTTTTELDSLIKANDSVTTDIVMKSMDQSNSLLDFVAEYNNPSKQNTNLPPSAATKSSESFTSAVSAESSSSSSSSGGMNSDDFLNLIDSDSNLEGGFSISVGPNVTLTPKTTPSSTHSSEDPLSLSDEEITFKTQATKPLPNRGFNSSDLEIHEEVDSETAAAEQQQRASAGAIADQEIGLDTEEPVNPVEIELDTITTEGSFDNSEIPVEPDTTPRRLHDEKSQPNNGSDANQSLDLTQIKEKVEEYQHFLTQQAELIAIDLEATNKAVKDAQDLFLSDGQVIPYTQSFMDDIQEKMLTCRNTEQTWIKLLDKNADELKDILKTLENNTDESSIELIRATVATLRENNALHQSLLNSSENINSHLFEIYNKFSSEDHFAKNIIISHEKVADKIVTKTEVSKNKVEQSTAKSSDGIEYEVTKTNLSYTGDKASLLTSTGDGKLTSGQNLITEMLIHNVQIQGKEPKPPQKINVSCTDPKMLAFALQTLAALEVPAHCVAAYVEKEGVKTPLQPNAIEAVYKLHLTDDKYATTYHEIKEDLSHRSIQQTQDGKKVSEFDLLKPQSVRASLRSAEKISANPNSMLSAASTQELEKQGQELHSAADELKRHNL